MLRAPTKLSHYQFVRKFRRLGFDGPFPAGSHEYMTLKERRQTIPSNSEYSVPQINMMMKQIESRVGHQISLEEWEAL